MNTKLFEIRDKGTCIAALACRLKPTEHLKPHERAHVEFLLDFAGYRDFESRPHVLLTILATNESQVDPEAWTQGRTMRAAHRWIIENWNELSYCQVVDARVILGEASEPAISDQFLSP